LKPERTRVLSSNPIKKDHWKIGLDSSDVIRVVSEVAVVVVVVVVVVVELNRTWQSC